MPASTAASEASLRSCELASQENGGSHSESPTAIPDHGLANLFRGRFLVLQGRSQRRPITNDPPDEVERILIPNDLRSPIASLAAARIFPQEDNLEQSSAAELLGRNKLDEVIFNSYLAPKAGSGVSVTRT